MACQVDGKMKYASRLTKLGEKTGGVVVTSWFVTIGSHPLAGVGAASREGMTEPDSSSVEPAFHDEPARLPHNKKPRNPHATRWGVGPSAN
jgi:hypothetical protein